MTAKVETIDHETGNSGAVAHYQEPRQTGTAITPMELLDRALAKGADVEQMAKLMDLQERWERNEARKAFVVAKAAFRAEAPSLEKNKLVDFTGNSGKRTTYRHSTLDYIAATLAPLLSKHGLDYAWKTEQPDGGAIRVTCVLTHVLGHSETVSLTAGPDNSGNKNSIQAVGSTVTFLSRYTLLSALGLATAEMDNDGKDHDEPVISAEQKQQIIDKQKALGLMGDTVEFLRFMKVETIDDLPEKEFPAAMKALDNRAHFLRQQAKKAEQS